MFQYFSMQTKAYFKLIRRQLLKELQAAKSSIFVAVAWFTDEKILELLSEKAREGCQVGILVMNDKTNAKAQPWYERINQSGGHVYLVPTYELEVEGRLTRKRDCTMHNKFCILDGKTVITGSYNWTLRAAHRNEENITVSDDPALVADFTEQFHALVMRYYPHTTLSQGIALYVDPEIEALRFQLDALQIQLEETQFDEEETLKIITQFEAAYIRYLGKLIEVILSLKEEKARLLLEAGLQAHKEDDRKNDEQLRADYEAAERAQKEYADNVKIKKIEPIPLTLNDGEQLELKQRYRKASHLCHPDKVPEASRIEAAKVFSVLNEAYKQNNLYKVNEICDSLERNGFKVAIKKLPDDKEKLRHKIRAIEIEVERARQRLEEVQTHSAYQVVRAVKDLDAYFDGQRVLLEAERSVLEQEVIILRKQTL
jgi:hypothetical protein